MSLILLWLDCRNKQDYVLLKDMLKHTTHHQRHSKELLKEEGVLHFLPHFLENNTIYVSWVSIF